ncbi:MBOAT family protein [Bradyrhizobium liaoningense]|uniref:MBOAT family protein n=1 Tax=Bradyrhizobium liaoningense TaxID=43992 RepID=UPI001BAD2ACA|nr:MBOAT family protein [Bradyrhizobium liaoningense]MBR1171001.1 MBOAT family protein [Bradyrhizobium liaoningense]
MSLTSPLFFAFLAGVVCAYHLSASASYRRLVLGLGNAIFIGSYLTDYTQVLPLLVFLLLGYACVSILSVWKSSIALGLGILGVLAYYVFLKRFSFFDDLGHLPFPYLTIGLSYILFRVLHVMVDVHSGDLDERIDPLAFFRYTCNFLCFVSGPIQRYQDFRTTDGTAVVELDADKVFQAFARVVAGYAKFVIIAAVAEYAFSFLKPQLFQAGDPSFAKLCMLYAVAASLYTVYLYYNFSGYMDIVIGSGTLLGQTLPENFDNPFSARSFLEFWQRWHMTLSQWFKFYLFNPLVMLLLSCFPAPALTAYLGVIAFFVTFLVMGVWHGTTAVFVVYGLLMGAGASINKLWQLACTERLGKKRYKAITETLAYIYFARGVTISYFVLALTCLWTPELLDFTRLIGRLGAAGMFAAFVGIALAFGSFWWLSDQVAPRLSAPAVLAAARDSLVGRNLTVASQIMAIVAVTTLLHKSPDFVYKAF